MKTRILKADLKSQKKEFIHIGKTFLSRERAKKKKVDLESKGYKLTKETSKSLTYILA